MIRLGERAPDCRTKFERLRGVGRMKICGVFDRHPCLHDFFEAAMMTPAQCAAQKRRDRLRPAKAPPVLYPSRPRCSVIRDGAVLVIFDHRS